MQKVKTYVCPIDKKAFKTLNGFGDHMRKFHPSEIPDGWSDARYFYYLQTGKRFGTCVVCKKQTDWNETTQKYNRFCNNPKCKDQYREEFKNRMIGKYGKVHLLDDPEQQRKMLANKKISGKYKFEDGGAVEYMGSYEKDFLFMLDQFLNLNSNDVMGPSPHTYYYLYRNKNDQEHEGIHFYIPDFYIPSLNLEVEIKQNTNTHPKLLAIDKVKEYEKDDVMKSNPSVNYIKIVEKDYSDFFKIFLDLKAYIDTKAPAPIKNLSLKPMDIEATKDTPASESYLPDDDDNYIDVKKVSGSLFSAKHNPVKIAAINNALQISGLKYAKDTIEDNNADISNTVILYIKNKEVVGSIEISPDNELKHLYVDEEWRNKGIATALIYCAINKFGGDQLFVYKNNKPACQLYNKVGFKVVRTDKDFYYMNLDKKPNNIATEGAIFNTEDIYYNKDKFDSNKTNLCFITGLSGSGKSTMAGNMSGRKIDHYQLDDVMANFNFSDQNLNDYGDLISSYFKTAGKKFRFYTKEEAANASDYETKIISSFIDYALQYASMHKDKKYIIEGVQLFQWIEPEKLKDYAVYIKGTSRLISAYRASKRDADYDAKNIKDKVNIFIHRLKNEIKYGNNFESRVQKWRNYFSSVNNNIATEALGYKNDAGEDVPKICLECGSPVKVFLKGGEPVFLCSNKDCNKYFGEVPFKTKESYLDTVTEEYLTDFSKYLSDYDEIDEIATEAAVYDDTHTYPVYIILMHNDELLSKIVKTFTDDDYTHAAISFDSSLNKLYSFGRKKSGVRDSGLTIVNPGIDFYKKYKTMYSVYVMFVTKSELDKMQRKLEWFVKNQDDMTYDYGGLILNALHLPSENKKKYFCSRFVAEILNSGIGMDKIPSMYRPQDLSELDNISKIIENYILSK